MTETEEFRRRIMEVLEYSPETGLFRWKVMYNSAQKRGWFSGSNKDGYLIIRFNRKSYKTHRLAWLIVYGDFPSGEIDHEDQNKWNNRISNLKDVSHKENSKNCALSKANKSGFTGVAFHKITGKWQASIRVDGKIVYLGLFDNIEDAIACRKQGNIEHGYHENHGKKEIT